VLVDLQQRKEYDFLRYNQEAYFQKYGASVLFQYAPKTDTLAVLVLLTVLLNYFSWWAQKQKWQRVANRLIQATVEDWTPSQGGTAESKLLREQALEELAKITAAEEEQQQTNSTAGGKKVAKLSAKEKKAKELEALKPIVEALVHEMKDFGAGFHQPTWKDLLSVKMVYWPIYIYQGAWWQTKYFIRRLQKKELNDEEKLVLTERAVGPVAWELAGEEERQGMVNRELWITENLAEYKEEQEVKTWSKADQKMYAKMKKKGTSGSFLKED
jgi:DnaJ homolog subfamily C member 25